MSEETVEVRNVNHPDYRGRGNAAKYTAMKAAVLTALAGSAGVTQTEMREAVKPLEAASREALMTAYREKRPAA